MVSGLCLRLSICSQCNVTLQIQVARGNAMVRLVLIAQTHSTVGGGAATPGAGKIALAASLAAHRASLRVVREVHCQGVAR